MKQFKRFSTHVEFNFGQFVKCSLMSILLGFSGFIKAQPSFYNGSSGASYSTNPLSDATNNKCQWIYGPNLFKSAGTTGTSASSGFITKIYFRLGTTVSSSASYANFTISLGQNQGTSTTWGSTTFSTSLTQVYFKSSFTMTGATASSWYGITLTTPLNYDPAKSLVFELKVSSGTGNQIAQTIVGGNQRNYGGYAGNTGTLATGLVDFGIDIKKSSNELEVLGLTNGLSNTCGATADPVFVQFRNNGFVDIAAGQNIPFKTVITGASSATLNGVYNRAIKVGATDTIHMGYLNTTAITGAINLKSWLTFALDSIQQTDTNVTSKTFLGPSKPKPDFKFTLFCDSVKFANSTTDVCSRATGYRWEFDNGKTSTLYSPTHSYNSFGTYNVKLLVFYGAGLKDSITKQVIVYAKPQANFYANNQCFGVAIDFSNFSYGSNAYKWSFGDASTSTVTSPSKSYTAAGTYSVKLVATTPSNCKDSISKNVIVYTKPVANFNVSNICAGMNANFNNVSTTGASYNWDLGDGTSSSFFSPAKVYNIPGSYGIILTVVTAQGCSDNTTRSIVVNALPVAGFNVQNNCKGIPTPFTNTSTGGNTYLWTFGDSKTSSSSSPSNTYNSANTFNITLLVNSSNGCTHSLTKPVTIYALPKVNFSVNDVCDGVAADFTNLSTLPSGGGDYIWRFGDGNNNTLANPTYKYASAGNYDVHLVAISSFGCKDSAISNISIFDKPKPSFTAADVCQGTAVQFINNTSNSVSQNWDFGDGAKDNTFSPTRNYAAAGTYKIVLSVTSRDNCKDVFEGNVTVKSIPELTFFANNHCLGTEAIFTNISVGASTFSWNFGDGDSSVSSQASHTYVAAGNYTVKLRGVSSKGCSVAQSKSLVVYPRPTPAFTAPRVCTGLTTQFTNTISAGTTYLWNFGDGSGNSTANNPSYQYFNAGNYKVILTATSSNNCKEEFSKIVQVSPLPVPIFILQDACEGTAISPNNVSQGIIGSQKWNFGDGILDTAKSPMHVYAAAGIYKIQLKLTSALGCTDSTSKTVLIYTKPVVKISSDVSISKGHNTKLLAGGGTDYLWSPASTLDNPLSSNPTATPTGETRYTVKVMNAFGCFDTASVNVSFIEDFAIEPQNLISPNGNGQNDLWKIKGIEFYPLANVMIFDQWGRILLEQTNYDNKWDGTYNGKLLPDGTYFYVIALPGSERLYKGTLNILKN